MSDATRTTHSREKSISYISISSTEPQITGKDDAPRQESPEFGSVEFHPIESTQSDSAHPDIIQTGSHQPDPDQARLNQVELKQPLLPPSSPPLRPASTPNGSGDTKQNGLLPPQISKPNLDTIDAEPFQPETEEKSDLDDHKVDDGEAEQLPGSAYVSLPNVSNKHIFAALRMLPVLPTVKLDEDEQGDESVSDIIQIAPDDNEQEAFDKLFGMLPDLYGQNQLELILKAYVVASYAHRNQKRQSGEAYVLHPIEVTCILANLRMDADTLAAGLLHDVAEDTEFGIDYIETHFGRPVANMVDGVTKLKRINQLSNVRQGIADQKAESLRKMFLAMVDDVRVVLIKLADRLHNMHTLDSQKSHKRRRIARETLEIFAPLANRLGIWQIKWQLEDISFQYLDPETYRYLSKVMEQRQDEREKWVNKIQKVLKRELANQGINADVSGRPKHIYSIWRKMQRKGVDFDQIYDVHGFRVLVETEAQCYAALGVVHSMWRPIPGEFDDYIANPKDNMYRSLHTAVLSRANGRPMEVQIRTSEMHQIAEYGIAAHWRYKEQTHHNRQFENKIAWLRQLMEWRQEVTDASEFVDSMKTDVFNDRVYVFTPQGEVVDLPTGSTPIDFAYSIHTELGHRCRGAKVDGKLVPLDYKLKNGEQVQVIASKRGGPTRDWLNPNLEYVATQRARSKIRSWLRKQAREDNIRQGKQVLEKETRRLSIQKSLNEIATIFNYEDADDFLAAVGYGDVNSQHIAQKLLEEERKEKEEDTQLNDIIAFGPDHRYASGQGVFVDGLDGMMTQMGRCCNPVPGDPIIGYVTRGRGVTIHRTSCANIAAHYQRNQNNRLIEVQWTNNHQDGYPVDIQVSAYDRAGLLRDFSILVAEEKVNILFVEALTGQKNNLALINATLEIHDVAQLTRILTKIDRLPNVVESQRRV